MLNETCKSIPRNTIYKAIQEMIDLNESINITSFVVVVVVVLTDTWAHYTVKTCISQLLEGLLQPLLDFNAKQSTELQTQFFQACPWGK